MDRVDQAVDMLRKNRSNGLSYYDSRQLLLQSGFNDNEIDDASDRLSEHKQSVQGQNAEADENHTSGGVQTNPRFTMPIVPAQPISPIYSPFSLQWYLINKRNGLILLGPFAIVFAAGNYYTKHHNHSVLLLYMAAVGLSAITAVYLNIIYNIQHTYSKSQRVASLVFGAVACAICFAFLWFVSIPVLR